MCGDLHGMFDLLDAALEAAGFDAQRDRLLALGDLIDRGDRSADYADYLAQPWFHSIMGNHEVMACAAVTEPTPENVGLWLANGGDWITSEPTAAYPELLAAVRILPLAIEAETRAGFRIGLTHAEMPAMTWKALEALLEQLPAEAFDFAGDTTVNQLLWSRRLVRGRRADPAPGIDHVFHGHTPIDDVKRLANRSYVDLGAYRSGQLCVLDVDAYLGGLAAA